MKFAKDMTTVEISESFLLGLKRIAAQGETNIRNGRLNPSNVEFTGIRTRTAYPSGQGSYASVSAAIKIVSLTKRGNIDRRVIKRVVSAIEDLMVTSEYTDDPVLLSSKSVIDAEIKEIKVLLEEAPRDAFLWY